MSPRTNSHPGGDRVLSPRESSRQLEGEIAMLRDELGGLVAELDRRRHELMDVKLQAKRHALGATLTGVGLLASAAGFVWLGTWRARRRRTTMARIGRLREAVSRMVERPERVAAEPCVPVKILTAAATAAAATAMKKVLERALHYVLRSRAERDALTPDASVRR
jgi:DNA-binding FrmR family transcriptional regulator